MNADPMSILELTSSRYVAITEAQAAELGSATYSEWCCACPDGVHVDARQWLATRDAAERWHALVGWWYMLVKVAIGAGLVAFWLTVAALIAGWLQ